MKKIIILLLSTLFVLGLKAQKNIDISAITSEEGLPQNTVIDIVQDNFGFLWLATNSGLVRYDGTNMYTYSSLNYPILKTDRFNKLLIDKNNRIWIGSIESGLLYLKDGEIKSLNYKEEEIKYVLKLSEYLDYLLIVDAEFKIKVLDLNTLKFVENHFLKESKEVKSIHVLNNELYVQTENKIRIYNKKTLKDEFDFVSENPIQFQYLKQDTLIFNSETQLIKRRNNKIIYRVLPKEVKLNNNKGITVFDSTIKLFNLNGGITNYNINNNRFSEEKLIGACENPALELIFKDKNQNLWYGTLTCGLLFQKPKYFEYVGKNLKIKNSYALYKDNNKNILIGTYNSDLFIFDSNLNFIKKLNNKELLNHFEIIYSIYQLNKDEYYITGSGNDIVRYDLKKGIKKIIRLKDFVGSSVKIIQKIDTAVFIGGNYPLSYIKNDSVFIHPINKLRKSSSSINYINKLKDNKYVASTDSGFFIFDNKGYFENHEINNQLVKKTRQSLEFRDLILFCTYGYGLVVYNRKTKEYKRLTKDDGLKENTISNIAINQDKNIILTGNHGITILQLKLLLDFIDDKIDFVITTHIDKNYGLKSVEFNGGIQNSLISLGNNKYLFSTFEGPVIFNSNIFKNKTKSILPYINKIKFNDVLINMFPKDTVLKFNYQSDNNLVFYHSLVNISLIPNVYIMYKLEGYNKSWKYTSTGSDITFTNLPPGNYSLIIKTFKMDGTLSNKSSDLKIIIIPPYDKTKLFIYTISIGSIITFSLLLYFIINFFIQRKRKELYNRIAMIRIMPNLYLIINKDGKYIDFFGNENELIKPFNELKNRNLREFIEKSLADIFLESINLSINENRLIQVKYKIKRYDKKIINYTAKFIKIDNQNCLVEISDITNYEAIKIRLNKYASKLKYRMIRERKLKEIIEIEQKDKINSILLAEEAERKRIALELHDGIGPLISLVKINLDFIEDSLIDKFNNNPKKIFFNTKLNVDKIAKEIRYLQYNLLPGSLQQFGLEDTVIEFIRDFTQYSNIEVEYEINIDRNKLNLHLEISFYRIIQELMNNIAKHSKATHVYIGLFNDDTLLSLLVKDNGIGFDVQKIGSKNLGIKNLKTRVQNLGGKVSIVSEHNKGSFIEIKVLFNEKFYN